MRLNKVVLNCQICGKNIAECCDMSISDLLDFLSTVNNPIVQPVLDAIRLRLNGLMSIG